MRMKKLLTLLLVLTGIAGTAKADDYVKGSWDGWTNTTQFTYDANGKGSLTLTLAAETTYEFQFIQNSTWIGHNQANQTMTNDNCIGWWLTAKESGNNNVKLTTSIAGDYNFIVKWVSSDNTNWYPSISVIYPVDKEYTIHCQKGNDWSSVYAHRWISLSGNTLDLTSWPGNQLSENTNNSRFYDLTFSDSYNYVQFTDNGSETNRFDGVGVNFSYPETWVINGTLQTTPPEGWIGYSRSVTEGNFGTICLPFAATITGATVFKVVSTVGTGDSMTGINLEEVDELEAGKAYIFKATGSTLTATYLTSSSYTAATDANGMLGNLSSTAAEVPEGNYIVRGNQIHKVVSGGSGVTVGQYKGYITLSGIEQASARGTNYIPFDEEQPTAISNVNGNLKSNITMYNLAGQRVAKDYKGIVIVNGQKMLNK